MAADDGVAPIANEPVPDHAFWLTAEWALWGRHATDTGHGVLECSAGTLIADDFDEIIRRYAAATPDRLPQYTVGWLRKADAHEYVALAIHEQTPYGPAQSGRGRGIIFVRLFCVRHADLAEHAVSYTELLDAVQRQELPPRAAAPGAAGPVTIRVRSQPPPAADFAAALAETVAALLLTTAPVCVLGAYELAAADRLAFIDEVVSLLPYGLRANLSASTWVNPIAQQLMLRLYFADAQRDDDGRTRHVGWGQPGPGGFPDPGGEAAPLYLDWLRRTGPRERSMLAGQKASLHFTDAAIREMVSGLSPEPTVTDTLEDLAASLGDGEVGDARAEAQRLERKLDDPLDPADRADYRRQVADMGLLKDHRGMPDSVKARIYRVLLRMVYETPLSYASYCAIEDAVGGPPHEALRSVMLRLEFTTFLPWLLTTKADRGTADEDLMETLAGQGRSAVAGLKEFLRDVENMRLAHRAVAYDFTVRYLRVEAKDPRAALRKRGYLADTLELVFPADLHDQQIRLQDTLLFVYNGKLNRGQIRELFADKALRPTAALQAALVNVASWPDPGKFIEQRAAYARLQYKAHVEETESARRTGLWHRFLRGHHGPPSPGDHKHTQDDDDPPTGYPR